MYDYVLQWHGKHTRHIVAHPRRIKGMGAKTGASRESQLRQLDCEADAGQESGRKEGPEMIDLTDARALSGLVIDGQLRAGRIQFGEAILIHPKEGRVEILNGLSPDEAGRQALDAFAKSYSDMFRRARLEALEEAAKIADDWAVAFLSDKMGGQHHGACSVAAALRERAKT
jgi:hypothetical protein